MDRSVILVRCSRITLTGCPSLNPRAEAPAISDNADAACTSWRTRWAPRACTSVAEQNSGTDRNEYLFGAARAIWTDDGPRRRPGFSRRSNNRDSPTIRRKAPVEVELALHGDKAKGMAAIGT